MTYSLNAQAIGWVEINKSIKPRINKRANHCRCSGRDKWVIFIENYIFKFLKNLFTLQNITKAYLYALKENWTLKNS